MVLRGPSSDHLRQPSRSFSRGHKIAAAPTDGSWLTGMTVKSYRSNRPGIRRPRCSQAHRLQSAASGTTNGENCDRRKKALGKTYPEAKGALSSSSPVLAGVGAASLPSDRRFLSCADGEQAQEMLKSRLRKLVQGYPNRVTSCTLARAGLRTKLLSPR